MVQRRVEPSDICITSISPINDFNVDLALHICMTSSVNMAVGLVPAHRLGLGPPHSHYTGVWWPLNRWHLSYFGFRSHEGYHHLHGMVPWIPLTRSFQILYHCPHSLQHCLQWLLMGLSSHWGCSQYSPLEVCWHGDKCPVSWEVLFCPLCLLKSLI